MDNRQYLTVTCPYCSGVVQGPIGVVGEVILCPHCGVRIVCDDSAASQSVRSRAVCATPGWPEPLAPGSVSAKPPVAVRDRTLCDGLPQHMQNDTTCSAREGCLLGLGMLVQMIGILAAAIGMLVFVIVVGFLVKFGLSEVGTMLRTIKNILF